VCDRWCQVRQEEFGADGSTCKSEEISKLTHVCMYVMCEVAIDQDGDTCMKMILCALQLDKIN